MCSSICTKAHSRFLPTALLKVHALRAGSRHSRISCPTRPRTSRSTRCRYSLRPDRGATPIARHLPEVEHLTGRSRACGSSEAGASRGGSCGDLKA